MNVQKKHLFLDELSDDELAQLHEAAKSGASMQSIANMIQQEWGKCTDKTPEALRKAVERYVVYIELQASVLPKKISQICKAKVHLQGDTFVRVLEARLARLEKALRREYATGVLDPEVSKELRYISELLEKPLFG